MEGEGRGLPEPGPHRKEQVLKGLFQRKSPNSATCTPPSPLQAGPGANFSCSRLPERNPEPGMSSDNGGDGPSLLGTVQGDQAWAWQWRGHPPYMGTVQGGLARLLGTCCGSGGEPHLHLIQSPPLQVRLPATSSPPRRSEVRGQHASKPSSAPSARHHPKAQPHDRRDPRPCAKNVPCSSCCSVSASSVSEKGEKESITRRPAPSVSRAKLGWGGMPHQNRNVPDTSSLRGNGLGGVGWGAGREATSSRMCPHPGPPLQDSLLPEAAGFCCCPSGNRGRTPP